MPGVEPIRDPFSPLPVKPLNVLTTLPGGGFSLPSCSHDNCPWPAYTGTTCDTHKEN